MFQERKRNSQGISGGIASNPIYQIIGMAAIIALHCGCSASPNSTKGDLQVKGEPLRRLSASVESGARIEEVFELVNSGENTILIESPRTSCGCSKATLSSTQVGPHEKCTLRMAVQAAMRDTKAQSVSALIRVIKPENHPPIIVGVEFRSCFALGS